MSSLFTELKKRKVFRVAAVYAVVAWLLIQVADVVLPALQLPEWTISFITVLFILGFPIALILAWAYEVTPEGIRADSGSRPISSPAAANQGLLYATFALVLVVAGFQVADRFLDAPNEGAATSNSSLGASGARPLTQIAVQLREEESFNEARGDFDLSPDGTFFVYLGNSGNADISSQLWLRRWDSLQGEPLAGTRNATRPRISPDGTQVVFPAEGAINVLTLSNGQTRKLVESSSSYRNFVPDWSGDGRSIYFTNANAGISRMPATGGAEEVLVEVSPDNGEDSFSFIEPLPGGNLLFTVMRTDGTKRIRGRDGASGRIVDLAEGNHPIYSSTGHLLYQQREGARLLAAPFDPEALAFLAPPVQIDDGLLLEGAGEVGSVGVSDTGRLIYRRGDSAGRLVTPVWVDRSGAVAEIEPDWQMVSAGGSGLASLSPRNDALAVSIRTNFLVADIWINRLDGPMTRITYGNQLAWQPSWSADGESVYYTVLGSLSSSSLMKKRADGSGVPQLVLESEFEIRQAVSSRDGRWLVYRDLPSASSGRLRALELGTQNEPITLVDSGNENTSPSLSPDGNWLAYVSDESGQFEVYVRPFPDVESGRWQISVDGGIEPVWANSGQELFYRNGDDELVVVDVNAAASFQWGEEQVLFDASPFRRSQGQVTSYSVANDDQRFLMMRRGEVLNTELVMVDNWTADLERR